MKGIGVGEQLRFQDFVPDQASTDIKQLTNLAVETSFTVQSLYENWKELDDMGKEKAEKTGWNKESLAKLIVYYANTWMKPSNEFTDVMDFQRRYQDSDLNFGPIYSDDVRIVSLFSREYDGSFTHYMFDRIHDTGDFIFKAESQYKSLEEALVIFTASPGEFTLHSNRGLGHKIFSGSQALMQLDCSLVDGARWAATILLKSPSTGAYDAEAIQFFPGVPTNIGSAEFQQNNLGANLDHLVGVSQHIYQKLNFNTANSGDDPGVPDRNVGSMAPEQARMNSIKEFSVLKNNISHFYAQFDHVIENMVIKMLHSKNGYPGYDTCKEWKRRCIADGVPEQMFETKGAKANEMPRHLRAKATRVAGDGSTLALIVGIQTMMATFGGSLGPREASEVKRMMITSLFGAEYVDVFMQDQDRVDEKSGGASVAGLENNTMQEGKAPVFSPDNEHRSHIVLHMGLGMQIVDQLGKQAISPVDADRVFRSLVPHLREHIDFLSQSIFAQSFLAGIEQPFRQLEDYAKLMRKNAARMIQAEQKRRAKEAEKQQEVMRDADRKDWVAQRDAERADMKVEAQIERAKEASDTRAGIQRQDTQNKASNERLKIQLDAKNETFKNMTDADLERERQLIAGNTIAPYDIEDNPKE